MEDAAAWLRVQKPENPLVVVRNSARRLHDSQSIERIKRTLQTRDVFRITEFLYKFAQRALGGIERSDLTDDDFGLQYFTEPDVHFPGTEEPKPSVESLLRWLRGDGDSESNIAVLLAPAAFGKSTLSEHLFLRLRGRQNSIPVLIQRDQWAELVARESLEMDDIWSSAVRKCYPDALIGPAQLETFLRTGVLCPVFDGLDELCAFFPSHFNPTETVGKLLDLFDDARAIITSRSQFWEENIEEGIQRRVLEVELKPFTPMQREEYLSKRFPDDSDKRSEAKRILDRIGGKAMTDQLRASPQLSLDSTMVPLRTTRFEAIPFVVMLTAESADTERTDVVSRYGSLLSANDPVQGLLLAFCDREALRHSLKLDPFQQLRLFELLATEFGSAFSEEDIELCLQDIQAPPDEYARIANHALLRYSRGRFRFQYDFIEEYLISRRIKQWLLESDSDEVGTQALRAVVRRQGSLVDRCAQLISGEVSDWIAAAEAKWASFPDDPVARSGFVILMLGLNKRFTGGARRDQTEVLLRIFGGLKEWNFRGLDFKGSISGLDLRNIRFNQCRFSNVEFTNCLFNEKTRFVECSIDDQFVITSCEAFSLAQFDRCSFSLQARGTIQREQGQQKLPITQRQIIGAMRDALRYFQQGSAGFTNRKVELFNARLRHVPFADQLLESLEKNRIIERRLQAGTEEFILVRTAEARVFLQNRTHVGHIKRVIDQLETELC